MPANSVDKMFQPAPPRLMAQGFKEIEGMGIPLHQVVRIGSYLLKKRLTGVKRYPLVLMLEPLFRCNLACAGCGKIDYPDEILNQRLPLEDCLSAVDECGAPVVVIAGGEPLLHKEIDQMVEGIIAKKKYAILCTNALLMEKKLDLFKPSPYFTWSVHLDGDREAHDKSVCQKGTYDRAVAAIKAAKDRASASASTAPSSTTPIRSAWRASSTASWRWGWRASPSRRATPMSAPPTSSTS